MQDIHKCEGVSFSLKNRAQDCVTKWGKLLLDWKVDVSFPLHPCTPAHPCTGTRLSPLDVTEIFYIAGKWPSKNSQSVETFSSQFYFKEENTSLFFFFFLRKYQRYNHYLVSF